MVAGVQAKAFNLFSRHDHVASVVDHCLEALCRLAGLAHAEVYDAVRVSPKLLSSAGRLYLGEQIETTATPEVPPSQPLRLA